MAESVRPVPLRRWGGRFIDWGSESWWWMPHLTINWRCILIYPSLSAGGGPAHVWRAEPGKRRRGVMRKGSIFFGAVAADHLPRLAASLHHSEGLSAFTLLRDAYDWIVLDIGSGEHALTRQMTAWSELLIVLALAEANCHLRLLRQALPRDAHLLITQLLPSSVLQEDIYLLWQQTLPALIPLVLHRDEAMAEAAASKQPVGEFAPHSLVAQEITSLAAWCLLQARAEPNQDPGGTTP